ncbi:MAG: VWA domain-containing protein [Candidatus Bathyarchaeia archaeon]
MSEIDVLRKISVVITGDSGVSLRIGKDARRARVDLHEIVISDSLIPVNVRHMPRMVARLREGQVIHESGHFLMTHPINDYLKSWFRKKGNKPLADGLVKIVEDVRVNHYLLNRYRFDLALRLKDFIDITGESFAYSLGRLRMKDPSKVPQHVRGAMILNLLALKTVYDRDSPHLMQVLRPDEREALEKACALVDRVRYVQSAPMLVEALNGVYELLRDHCHIIERAYMTVSLGGRLGLVAPELFIEREVAAERSLRREGEVEEEIREREGSVSAGSGSGILIPAPKANSARYQFLVQRNMAHIQRLLSVLKSNVRPKISFVKWSKRGRLMNEIVPKAIAASHIREVDNIYESRDIQVERESVAILLIVDLSGSMNVYQAEDFLTTVSEVMGRWLRDEDFAILVYGSQYQKIKAFVEPYHTTRFRIGGISSMGGTVLLNPLREAHRMFNALRNHRKKLCVIISDFHIDQSGGCIKEIRNMGRDGIEVIGIGICTAFERGVRMYTQNVVMCENISNLADRFVDVYRRIALG